MGPLIPFIFSNEFGLVIALIIGIAFGFVLEQAGFSSTKKLVGLFYGYDFTVLRVFFTAGITAMMGVLILDHVGLLDMDIIYINPTFLRSAIVGGLIMGGGFIIGGFCPGTSVCAAAIGKIDAMAFIIGSFAGIFVFTEFYPVFEPFYMKDALGDVTMADMLGISVNLFAFLLIAVALLAFYFTWRIENRVNNRTFNLITPLHKKYMLSFSFLFIALLTIIVLPDHNQRMEKKISRSMNTLLFENKTIDADKLAFELTNNSYNLNIIDIRTPEEYAGFHIPMAVNIPANQLSNREWETIFSQKTKKNILYASNDSLLKRAYLKAGYLGNASNYLLKETANEFEQMFFHPEIPAADASKNDHTLYLFRMQSGLKMKELLESLQHIGKPVKKVVKKVKGGCS